MDDPWTEYRKILLSSLENLTNSHAKLVEQVQNLSVRMAVTEKQLNGFEDIKCSIHDVSARCDQIQKDLLVLQGQMQVFSTVAKLVDDLDKKIDQLETNLAVQKVVNGFIGGLSGAAGGALAILTKILTG